MQNFDRIMSTNCDLKFVLLGGAPGLRPFPPLLGCAAPMTSENHEAPRYKVLFNSLLLPSAVEVSLSTSLYSPPSMQETNFHTQTKTIKISTLT